MTSAVDVAKSYLDASRRKDVATMERLLDDGVSFEGPLMQLSGKEQFLGAMKQLLGSWEVEFEHLRSAESGRDAALLYDFVMKPPVPQTVRMTEWYRVDGGRIAEMRLSFDPAKFTPPEGAGG